MGRKKRGSEKRASFPNKWQKLADTQYKWQLQAPFPCLGQVFINIPHNINTRRTWKPTIHCYHAVHSG
jgi:hypothetical protein